MSSILEGTRKPHGSIANLTQDHLDLYEEALSRGIARTRAIGLLGLTPEGWSDARKTFCEAHGYEWEQITLEQIHTLQTTLKQLKPREQNILKLLAIEKGSANIERERALLQKIDEAGNDPKYWTANAWLLERMYGHTQKQTIDHQGIPPQPQIIITQDTLAKAGELLEHIEEAEVIEE